MQTNKIHWYSVLILIVFGVSALLLMLLALFMGGMSIYDLVKDKSSPATEMINAFVFGFEALFILLCGWFVLQKTMKRGQADLPIQFPFSAWRIFAALGIVLPALIVGGLVAYAEISWLSWLVLPLFTVLVITPPIWLLLGIGGGGIELGPRWRFFGILGLGMTLSPFVMIVMEMIGLVIVLIIVLIFVVAQPGLLNELQNLRTLIQAETNQDVILQLLAPYIVKPGVIVTILVYIALFVPLIEELFKPLAVWLFAKSIDSPAQGFVLGALSGAAFALVESLNASADGSSSWPLIVSVRAGTTLLHITASGLVGWGIASAFCERKIFRFIAAYLSSVAIHGLWNACALAAGLSSIGYMVGKPEWVFAIVPAAIGGMFVLGVGMFSILIAANRKLRNTSQVIRHSEQGSETLSGAQSS